jgi:hypothetical protein
MGIRFPRKIIVFGIILVLAGLPLTTPITSKESGSVPIRTEYPDGSILFSPMMSTTTYQMDYNGNIIHTWPDTYLPGYAVYPLENGSILRAAAYDFTIGGMVQKIAWNGDILWQYVYDSNGKLSHHDIEPLPNGNVLITAWESKTEAEAIAAGRNPDIQPSGGLTPDHIIEVKPTGPTSGDIVWEWHVWDHLVQEYDSSKENYGVVADHPELIDINFFSQHSILISDWTHVNAVDYNHDLDQILLSSWYFNEIWVIDHNTTTQEAAGHSGGCHGHGGDLLYRWGNPRTYHAGTSMDEKLFGQHDAQWIEAGCPGYGDILVFNNGLDRPEGAYSSVEEIIPPVNQNGTYIYTPDQPYQPESPVWIYTDPNPTDFYSSKISGCQRLPNGNTLICSGMNGVFFEVTPGKNKIWEYTNPYPNAVTNQVFKIRYIPPGQPGPDLEGNGDLLWRRAQPGSRQTGSFTVANIGDAHSKLNWAIVSYPEWGNWTFTPVSGQNLTPEEGSMIIQVEVIIPEEHYEQFTGQIRIDNLQDTSDYDIIPIALSTPLAIPHTFNHLHNLRSLYDLILHLRNQIHQRFNPQ